MGNSFPILFSSASIGSMLLKNHIVRSATFEALADNNGCVTPNYLDFYRRLASGGAGLVITGYASPLSNGRFHHMLSVEDERCTEDLGKIVRAVKEEDPSCMLALQIGHCGRQLSGGQDRAVSAPSSVLEPVYSRMPVIMSSGEVEEFIEKTAASALYAKNSGFDAVQFHAAHGYLLSSFLSPRTNHRHDRYGGSTENRSRALSDIIRRTLQLTGDDFPVMVKMNGSDFLPDGIELEESLEIGMLLENAGASALEISSCMWETSLRSADELGWKAEMIPESRKHIPSSGNAYHRPFTRAFRGKLARAKVILVGGIRSAGQAEEILESGDCDFIALSRPLIREPDLPLQWEKGIIKSASCISCNACIKELKKNGVCCPLDIH